ncbi:MAG: hypothetical protein IKJ30_05040 [Bacilli bacterium]|nr:hypothetical protein [Bacilli bacterium]
MADIETLKKLCNFDGDKYTQKTGLDYLTALELVMGAVNRNDKPFSITEIISQPTLKEFTFEGVKEFKYVCKLHAYPMIIKNNHRKNEKIVPYDFANDEMKNIFNNSMGVVYIFTCPYENKEYIVKIGQTRTPFSKRLGSYNCGVINNWRTASTTNIKILQSMVATGLDFKLYIYDCSDDPYILTWHGVTSVPFAASKALAVEDIMIKKFIEQFNRKPLANIQANATETD